MKKLISILCLLPALAWAGIVTDGMQLGTNAPTTSISGSFTALYTDPVVVPTVLVSAPTVTLSRATGRYMMLDMTNNVILQFSTNNVLNETEYGFRLDVRMNSSSLTWDTNYFMSTNLATMATNVYVPVIGVRPYGGGLIEIR